MMSESEGHNRVIFVQTPGYEGARDSVRLAVERLGGIRQFVRPGERILIKPNLLAPTLPEQAVVTHPAVFAAVVELVIEAGAKALVGDSPPYRSLHRLMERTGHLQAARETGAEITEFRESVEVDIAGPFRELLISKEAYEADGIINLPKLKTHGQMGLTLAVKNLFGCIVGMRKPEWHFRAGSDADLFATVILGTYTSLRPRLNLVDGILALEGDGPGLGGSPVRLGWIVAGADATAVDYAIAEALGVKPEELPLVRCAQRNGVQIYPEVEGELKKPETFQLPGEKNIVFGPRTFRRIFRRWLTARPKAESSVCTLCGECIRYCPAGAMSQPPTSGPVAVDYDRCIRCYCCLEVCPQGAMKIRGGWFGTIRRPFS